MNPLQPTTGPNSKLHHLVLILVINQLNLLAPELFFKF